jgi:hypothetical protein
MKISPQSLTFQAHAVPVHGASYGALDGYMAIEPEKLHAKQSSVLFRVNVPQSMAKGQPQAPSVLGLAWADARTERVNDFATPDVMNLLCRAVAFVG